MKIKDILDIANQDYPDAFLSNYYDAEGERKHGSGDRLAEFIVSELIDTYVESASDHDQLGEAVRVLESALSDLGYAKDALEEKLSEASVGFPLQAAASDEPQGADLLDPLEPFLPKIPKTDRDALEAIRDYPANSNSEPDVMGEAIECMQAIAAAQLEGDDWEAPDGE